jgi:hypothetical protein
MSIGQSHEALLDFFPQQTSRFVMAASDVLTAR